jgi:hypothetical protein
VMGTRRVTVPHVQRRGENTAGGSILTAIDGGTSWRARTAAQNVTQLPAVACPTPVSARGRLSSAGREMRTTPEGCSGATIPV